MDQTFLIRHLIDYPTPQLLFHYTTPKAEKLIRETQELRLTKFNSSNDGSEFSYGLSLVKECLQRFCAEDSIKEAFIDKFLLFFEEEINLPSIFFYMICFCRNSQNTYLKKRYSKGNGKALRFYFNNQDFSGRAGLLAPVLYSSTNFQRNISKGLSNYYNFMRINLNKWILENSYENNMQNLMLALTRDLFCSASFVKKPTFYPEQEHRMILWGTDHNQLYVYFPLSHSALGG